MISSLIYKNINKLRNNILKGIVSRVESKDIYVLSDNKEIRCTFRGKLKLETGFKEDKYIYDDLFVPGDIVDIKLENNLGILEEIPERKNYVSRKMPRIKGVLPKRRKKEQIIAANVDNTFCITSAKSPQFNNRALDRLLIISESCKTKPIIVINKIDLDKDEDYKFWKDLYTKLNYDVILASVITGKGIEEIKKILNNKVNLFIGHSGVGKSSIINKLSDKINQKVGEVSEAWDKGKHTTVTSKLFLLNENTCIIDTPGLKELEPYGLTLNDLNFYFRDINEFSSECKFYNCTHTHEPDCNVRAAVELGKIHPLRFDSYLRLISSIEEDEF